LLCLLSVSESLQDVVERSEKLSLSFIVFGTRAFFVSFFIKKKIEIILGVADSLLLLFLKEEIYSRIDIF